MKLVVSRKKLNSSEFWFKVVCCIVWVRPTIISFVHTVLERIFHTSVVGNFVVGIMCTICVLLAFPYIKNKIRFWDFAFYALFLFAYIVSLLGTSYSQVRIYLWDNIFEILILTVPVYFFGVLINVEDDSFVDIFHTLSVLSLIANVVGLLLIGMSNINVEDSMGRAYRLLPLACMFLHFFMQNRKAYDLVCLIVSSVLILGFSSRGPVLVLVLFAIFYLIFMVNGWKRWIVVFFLSTSAIIFFKFFNQIVILLSGILSSLGMSQRVVNALSNKAFFDFNSRDSIASFMLDHVRLRPITGFGLAGDRMYRGVYVIRQTNGIAYSHNYFVEILVSFGWIMGIAIIILTLLILYKGLLKKDISQNRKAFCIILFFCAFVKLFISSSFLVEPFFFLLIGLCVANIRYDRKKNHYLMKEG